MSEKKLIFIFMMIIAALGRFLINDWKIISGIFLLMWSNTISLTKL